MIGENVPGNIYYEYLVSFLSISWVPITMVPVNIYILPGTQVVSELLFPLIIKSSTVYCPIRNQPQSTHPSYA